MSDDEPHSAPPRGDARESGPDSSRESAPPDSMEEAFQEGMRDSRPSLDGGAPSLDEVDIRDALREAMRAPDDVSIARKVQARLRDDPELKGQFFADGWSTSRAPKETYLITSIVMLIVAVVVYALIRPYGM